MKKVKNYLLIVLFSIMSFICGVTINSANADSPKVPNTQNINNVQRISYEIVYVNGIKCAVFTNSSGSDIEVVKLYN